MNEDQIIGRIAAIEYILNQTFSFSLTQFEAPLDALAECEKHLARNLEVSGLNDDQKRMAQEYSSRFYSAVRTSIVSEGGQNLDRHLND